MREQPRISLSRDGFVCLVFAVYALAFHVGRSWLANPFLALSADGSTIASFAAALDDPGAFVGDSALGDAANLRFYLALHIPLVRAMARITGEYGAGLASLLGLHVFVHAVGFYVLGRVLFGQRSWAFLLALITLAPVPLNLYLQWGIHEDPLPRLTFQALLPFLLAATLAWRKCPQRWPWLFLALGALMYVHAVSTPAWAAGIWLGLGLQRPSAWSRGRHAAAMLGLGLLYLVASSGFLWAYLSGHAHGTPEGASFATVWEIFERFLPRGYWDAPYALREFAALRSPAEIVLWAWALVGAAVVWRLAPEDRPQLGMLGAWLLGIAGVSLVLPWAEQWRAHAQGAVPVQIDLIRGIRFSVLFLLIFSLWPLAAAHRRLLGSRPTPRWAAALLLAGIALTASWTAAHPARYPLDALACWVRGRFTCAPPGWAHIAEALEAVRREVPPGGRILPTRLAFPLHVRYFARRPVVHSRRDLNVLLYANHAQLPRWYDSHKRMMVAERLRTPGQRARAHVAQARELGAEFALLHRAYLGGLLRPGQRYADADVLFANRAFALLRVAEAPADAPARASLPLRIDQKRVDPERTQSP